MIRSGLCQLLWSVLPSARFGAGRAAVLFAVLLTLVSCSRPDGPANVITERFENGRFNPTAWRIDPKKLPQASFDFETDGLAIRIPAEATGGEPAEIKSQFRLGGDFDISLEYSIQSLPKPEQGYLNLEVSLYGPQGSLAFMRTQQASQGPGFAVWHQPSEKGSKSVWKFAKTDPDLEGRSELWLERRGAVITFRARTSPKSEFQEIGTLDYPSDLSSVQFRVTGKPVKRPVDVRMHGLRVAADRIWYSGEAPVKRNAPAGFSRLAIGVTVLTAVVAAAVFLLLYSRRAR